MKSSMQTARGSVLWVALVAIIVALALAMSMLQTTVSNFKAQDKYTTDNTAFFTTHGATELVMTDWWGRFNGQTTVTSFATYLTNNISFSLIAQGSGDTIADDFRQGPHSYTVPATVGAAPTLDSPTKVYGAILTRYNDIRLGDRYITGVRIYKKDRPVPGQYVIDLLVVAETQKYLGTAAATQVSSESSMSAADVASQFQPQWESQLFKFTSPPNFNGFDYALLTKNLTCTLCHMRVRSRAVMDNLAGTLQTPAQPKTLFGNFDRVKVGITDYLGVRSGQEYSQIDGTLYDRGQVQYEGNHNNMTAAQVMAEQMDSVAFNPNASTVIQDGTTGAVAPCPFVNQTTDSSGSQVAIPPVNGNLYLNYANSNAGETDGMLPGNNFPSAFPEIPKTVTLSNGQQITGPDNKVNPDEVTAAMTGLYSYVDPTQSSSLTGGNSVALAAGVQYTNATLPVGSTSVTTGSGSVVPKAANIAGSYTGNLVITGTPANPINIDGKVVIDGDVILRGYVQGTGQLYVTGNIYVPGDVIYNDVNVGTLNEKFGVNNDPNPKKQNNLLAMVAGKNIVIGDYLSQVSHWNSGLNDFFTTYTYNKNNNTVTPHNGMPESGKKESYVAGSSTNNFLNAYQMDINPSVSLSGVSVASGSTLPSGVSLPGTFGGTNFANFTMEQLAYFNRNELMKVMPKLPTSDPTQASSYGTAGAANPFYDPNYIPKFYSFYKYDAANPANTPAEAFLYSGSNYDATNNHWNGTDDPHVYDYFTPVDSLPSNALSQAAKEARNIVNIHPDWVDPNVMMKIISDEQNKHVAVIADPQYGASSSSYMVPDRRLDGVLYTKNAIFCIERKQSQYYDPATGKWSKVDAKSGGYMQVNGALVAPDTGILVTGNSANNFQMDSNNRQAFLINYDPRVKSFMAMGNQDFTQFTTWGVMRQGLVRVAAPLPVSTATFGVTSQ